MYYCRKHKAAARAPSVNEVLESPTVADESTRPDNNVITTGLGDSIRPGIGLVCPDCNIVVPGPQSLQAHMSARHPAPAPKVIPSNQTSAASPLVPVFHREYNDSEIVAQILSVKAPDESGNASLHISDGKLWIPAILPLPFSRYLG